MCWMCDHPGSTVADFLDVIRGKIAERGWAVQYVEDPQMPFAYTAGLTNYLLPELLMTNVSTARAARVLNGVAEFLVDGLELWPGRQVSLPGGLLVEVVEVDHPEVHLPAAVRDPRAHPRIPAGLGRRSRPLAVGGGLLRSEEPTAGARHADDRLVPVRDDVEHVAIRGAHEEPVHSPRFDRGRVDDLVADPLDSRMRPQVVRYDRGVFGRGRARSAVFSGAPESVSVMAGRIVLVDSADRDDAGAGSSAAAVGPSPSNVAPHATPSGAVTTPVGRVLPSVRVDRDDAGALDRRRALPVPVVRHLLGVRHLRA